MTIVGKHLCGVATDFALRAAAAGEEEGEKEDGEKEEGKEKRRVRVDGIFLALCCHQRCEWRGVGVLSHGTGCCCPSSPLSIHRFPSSARSLSLSLLLYSTV